MKERTKRVIVNSKNSPPNIAVGILKTGSPLRTWFEGRANAYDTQKTAKNTAPIPCVRSTSHAI